MTTKEFNNSIISNCLGEFLDNEGNTNVVYIEYRDDTNELIAGNVCNTVIIPITSIDYDDDLSIDANIEILWDKLDYIGFERIG